MKKKILTSLLTTLMVSTLVAPVVFADAERELQGVADNFIPPYVMSNPSLDGKTTVLVKIDREKFKSISVKDLVKGRIYRITDNSNNLIGYYKYVDSVYYEERNGNMYVQGQPINMDRKVSIYNFLRVDEEGNEIENDITKFGAYIEFGNVTEYLDGYRIYCEK